MALSMLFQSTRPIRGATYCHVVLLIHIDNFNPRAPYGARLDADVEVCVPCVNFNPRAPYGARPAIPCTPPPGVLFQSTRPIRGATRSRPGVCGNAHISIHAPHTGRDAGCSRWDLFTIAFQSTRPIRGATGSSRIRCIQAGDFNPRAPYGARRFLIVEDVHIPCISIHAPHTGRDPSTRRSTMGWILFQSTRPIRGATSMLFVPDFPFDISIHAPHTGRDRLLLKSILKARLISIHAPHTGRDNAAAEVGVNAK